MRLRAWVRSAGKGAKWRLAAATGISYQTIHALAAADCTQRAKYKTAKLISDATDGAVSIKELCDPPLTAEQRRKAEAVARVRSAVRSAKQKRKRRVEALQPAAHG